MDSQNDDVNNLHYNFDTFTNSNATPPTTVNTGFGWVGFGGCGNFFDDGSVTTTIDSDGIGGHENVASSAHNNDGTIVGISPPK